MIYPKHLVLYPPIHTQVETQKIISVLKHLPVTSSILDFGAGTGRLTLPLIQAGFKPDVVEPDPQSLQTLTTVIPKSIKIYDAIPPKSYSAIVGTDVLHHINIAEYLPLLYRHLKPGGLICFSEPNALNPFWYIQPQMFLYWNLEKGLLQINASKIFRLLHTIGFDNINLTGIGLLPRPLFAFSHKVALFTDSFGNLDFMKNFAYRLLISAQK